MYLRLASRTTSRADLPSRKTTIAMSAALVLCLFAFVLLAGGEAWAAEQPSKTTQPGTVESTTTINGKVAEPVPGATKPPVVVTPPVEKPAAEDPAPPPPTNETPPAKEPSPPPPTNETPPVEEPSPLPPRNETPPAEEPSQPPTGPAPSTLEPEVAAPQPTTRPATQWFTATTAGEVVESAPVVLTTSQSVTDFSRVLEPKPMPNDSSDVTPGVIDPALVSAAPAAGADDGYASGPAPNPVLPVSGPTAASEQVLPAASGLAGLVRGLVAEPAVPWRHGDPPRTPVNPTAVTGLTPSTPVPTVPASVGGAFRLPSSVGTTTASAVGTVQSAAASVASATAEVLGTLTGSLTESSAAGTQEDQPSEGTPQPAPPLAPPAGGGSFSPFTGGGGQLGTGGGSAPLLVGMLALLTTSLLSRRDFRTYLISCEMPKPSSALLGPLERPG